LSVFVDTSVWSLALRRDDPPPLAQIDELRRELEKGSVFSTGLVLQELLQGFSRPKAHRQIIKHFTSIPLLIPDRNDHVQAAELRNVCRKKGKQIGTIDALLAQLCIRHELPLLTTDKDFEHIAGIASLSLWHTGM
jgi:predicted nucleic acid-binding protein